MPRNRHGSAGTEPRKPLSLVPRQPPARRAAPGACRVSGTETARLPADAAPRRDHLGRIAMKCVPVLILIAALASGCAAAAPEIRRQTESPALPAPEAVAAEVEGEVEGELVEVGTGPSVSGPSSESAESRGAYLDMNAVLTDKGIPTTVENEGGFTIWVYEESGGRQYFYFRKGLVSGNRFVP